MCGATLIDNTALVTRKVKVGHKGEGVCLHAMKVKGGKSGGINPLILYSRQINRSAL